MANHNSVFGDVLCVLHVCEQLPESLVLHRDPADTHGDEGGKRPKATHQSEVAILPGMSFFPSTKEKDDLSKSWLTRACPKCVSMETEGGTAGFGSPGPEGRVSTEDEEGRVFCYV